MRWLAKSAVQHVVARLPHSQDVNYLLQRRVSRRLPIPLPQLLKKVGWARRHLEGIERFGPEKPLSSLEFYEFGAGWDLVVPLALWSAGVEHQTVVDLTPHVRLELLDASLEKFSRHRAAIEEALGRPTRPVPGSGFGIGELERVFGIRYLAPIDARRTPFPSGTFDVITTSDTLEHVPVGDLPAIVAECRRLLTDEGVMSHLVDLMDHYRYVDDRITVYNFLRFPDAVWRVLDSPIEHQNRLRLPAYRQLVQEGGFVLHDEEVRGPDQRDLERLRSVPLAPRFRRMDPRDVGAKSVKLVATVRRSADPSAGAS